MSDENRLTKQRKQAQNLQKGSVDAFLKKVAQTPMASSALGRSGAARGRLLFAMDATASRQPAWDRAATIQAEMFHQTDAIGGLDVQLAFYRGYGEFKVSKWASQASELTRLMTSVTCLAGETQIGKVLSHARNSAREGKVNALVFVGDACEEDVDYLGKRAGELGMLGVPAFMFHEGDDPVTAYAFKQIATLTRGAYCRFDAASADQLKELLGAVAVYAAGGRKALADYGSRQGGAIQMIAHQVTGEK